MDLQIHGDFKKIIQASKSNTMSRYVIHVYHGGELPDQTFFTEKLTEAEAYARKGEHSEIIDLNDEIDFEFLN